MLSVFLSQLLALANVVAAANKETFPHAVMVPNQWLGCVRLLPRWCRDEEKNEDRATLYHVWRGEGKNVGGEERVCETRDFSSPLTIFSSFPCCHLSAFPFFFFPFSFSTPARALYILQPFTTSNAAALEFLREEKTRKAGRRIW